MRRRHFLLGAAGVGLLGLWGARPARGPGGGHDDYFQALSALLHRHRLARPTLIVDLDRVDANLAQLQQHLGPHAYRIVAKSIPVPGLIEHAMRVAGTQRLMAFHQPFLNAIAQRQPDADLLLGKPMPVAAAARFYDHHPAGGLDPARQIQWLIDTPERLAQYAALAQGRELDLAINIEIDVGLHRGGVADSGTLDAMLRQIEAHPRLRFAGLMGYDPHVAKAPDLLGLRRREREAVSRRYAEALERVRAQVAEPELMALTLNAAGSPTLHDWTGIHGLANEVAAGSAIVKPLDFDIPSLAAHQPAVFIATPVLKTAEGVDMPILPAIGAAQEAWNPNRARTFFVYGGYWKARPVSPPGLVTNPMYGHSTNQEMLNGSADIRLEADDYVFYRPTQSEFVMLQFGDVLAVRRGELVASWPVFSQAA